MSNWIKKFLDVALSRNDVLLMLSHSLIQCKPFDGLWNGMIQHYGQTNEEKIKGLQECLEYEERTRIQRDEGCRVQWQTAAELEIGGN